MSPTLKSVALAGSRSFRNSVWPVSFTVNVWPSGVANSIAPSRTAVIFPNNGRGPPSPRCLVPGFCDTAAPLAGSWPPALGGFCPLELSGACARAPMAPNNPRQPMPIINKTSLRFTLHLTPESSCSLDVRPCSPVSCDCRHLWGDASNRLPSKPSEGSRPTLDLLSRFVEISLQRPKIFLVPFESETAQPFTATFNILRLASTKDLTYKSAFPFADSGFVTNCAVLQPARLPASTSVSESPIIHEDRKSI